MKILIDVDAVAPPQDAMIEEGLANVSLPSCLGMQILPFVPKTVEVEDLDILEVAVTSKSNISHDLSTLVISPAMSAENMTLKTEGLQYIKDIKEAQTQKYIEQVKRCVDCSHQELCYKLTTNSLKALELVTKDSK